MHPEIQEKAQREVEAVVGPERVPSFEDLERLPYIQAIVKEVGRWHTVVPLGKCLPQTRLRCIGGTAHYGIGVPHSATNDDELNGFRIPAGTLILTNNW
jgi:cytochrome P450